MEEICTSCHHIQPVFHLYTNKKRNTQPLPHMMTNANRTHRSTIAPHSTRLHPTRSPSWYHTRHTALAITFTTMYEHTANA